MLVIGKWKLVLEVGEYKIVSTFTYQISKLTSVF